MPATTVDVRCAPGVEWRAYEYDLVCGVGVARLYQLAPRGASKIVPWESGPNGWAGRQPNKCVKNRKGECKEQTGFVFKRSFNRESKLFLDPAQV